MRKRKVLTLVFFDVLLINLSYLLALYIRFEGKIGGAQFTKYLEIYGQNFFYITAIKLAVFFLFKMYKCALRYASIPDLMNIVAAINTANIAAIAYVFFSDMAFPRSVLIISVLLDIMFIGGIRFSFRALTSIWKAYTTKKYKKKIMVVGAGDAGAMVIREFKNHTGLNSRPVAIIDDNPSKLGQTVNGIMVMGNRKDIPKLVEDLKIDEIVIAIPSSTRKQVGDIVEIAKATDAKLKILPGMFELIDGKIDVKKIRDVQIEDLLGRDEIKMDLKSISSYITGKVVMVTGGGGSIGSELCRQIVRFDPKKLVVLDIYENSIYDIQNEIIRFNPDVNLKAYIGSIRDRKRIDFIMDREGPDVVFHAAAHKHVPLMEGSPKESIKNNVFGTLNLAQSADMFDVGKFVMISTDKAVNPTNIMGASKRICEMIVQSINVNSKTDFVAVRFGNVLGSNGSVIPLFKKQIAEGGPVTVTHKNIIRYFMTIPEAVQLVIEAGSMANGGEVFVLDMGEPVRIIDLARDLIHLSGYEPDVDMPIVVTGLRPGEKLFEELLLAEEGLSDTRHDKIFIGKPTFTDYKLLLRSLAEVQNIINSGTEYELKKYIQNIVPNYTIKNEIKLQEMEA